jgi:small subunit ribosomal protein S2
MVDEKKPDAEISEEDYIRNVTDLLVPSDTYLSRGVHIGTQQKTGHIERFIYRVRNDGLYVIDVKQTDAKIKAAVKMLARYDPSKILIVSARQYGQRPVKIFGEATGAKANAGRFTPGMLTNPNIPNYYEPEIIVITDPLVDSQALREAVNIGIPIIGLCDTNNDTGYIDLAIPTNNKGRRALALIYWLMARELQKERGIIKDYSEFAFKLEDFEAAL